LIAFPPNAIPGLFGGPFDGYYTPPALLGLPDGSAPLIDVAFLQPDEAVIVSQWLNSLSIPPEVSFTEERGPFNDAYLGAGYHTFLWLIFAINCIILLLGVYRIVIRAVRRDIPLTLRTVIFLMGLVATLLNTISLPLNILSWRVQLLSYFPSTIFALAFNLVLIIWVRMLEQLHIERNVRTFRVFIGVSILCDVLNFVNAICWILVTDPAIVAWTAWMKAISDIFTLIGQSAIAVLFALYTFRFVMKRRDADLNKESQRGLSRLTAISVLGFMTFLCAFIANVFVVQPSATTNVGGSVAIIVGRAIVATVRAAALLVVLNLGGSKKEVVPSIGPSGGGGFRPRSDSGSSAMSEKDGQQRARSGSFGWIRERLSLTMGS